MWLLCFTIFLCLCEYSVMRRGAFRRVNLGVICMTNVSRCHIYFEQTLLLTLR